MNTLMQKLESRTWIAKVLGEEVKVKVPKIKIGYPLLVGYMELEKKAKDAEGDIMSLKDDLIDWNIKAISECTEISKGDADKLLKQANAECGDLLLKVKLALGIYNEETIKKLQEDDMPFFVARATGRTLKEVGEMDTQEYLAWARHLNRHPVNSDFRAHGILAQLTAKTLELHGNKGELVDPLTYMPWIKELSENHKEEDIKKGKDGNESFKVNIDWSKVDYVNPPKEANNAN